MPKRVHHSDEARKLAERERKKAYNDSKVALGSSFDEFERHRLHCGFAKRAEFIVHLLQLHTVHCRIFQSADVKPNVLEASNPTPLCCGQTASDVDNSEGPGDSGTIDADVEHDLEDIDQTRDVGNKLESIDQIRNVTNPLESIDNRDFEHPFQSIDTIREFEHPLECIGKIKVETVTEDIDVINDDNVKTDNFNQDNCQSVGNDPTKVLETADSVVAFQIATNQNTQDESKPFLCTFCGKSYNSSRNLKKHQRLRHVTNVDIDKLTCPVCKKVFANTAYVRRHYKMVHSGEKSFQCKHCNKSFCNNDKRKRHELTHTGVKPFSCMYCKRGFNQKGNLKTHERTHTGEKPYVCLHCGMTFAHAVRLRIHEQKH